MAGNDFLNLLAQGAGLLDRAMQMLPPTVNPGTSGGAGGAVRKPTDPNRMFQVAHRVLDAFEPPRRRRLF